MTFREIHGLTIGEFERLREHQHVLAAVSARGGGVGEPPFDSLNLGLHVPDRTEHVLENRRRLCAALGIEPQALVVPQQVHGARVAQVGRADRGRGALDLASAVAETDGLITDEPGLALMAFSSDCPLILLYDPARPAIGLLHAGWRGTVARIAAHGVEKMKDAFGTRPDELIACTAPSVGPCCYEVRADVIAAASQAGLPVERLVQRRGDATFFDLWRANEEQLVGAGLSRNRISLPAVCTACRPDLFFSLRVANGQTGRFAAVLMLRE